MRINERRHFKGLYRLDPGDLKLSPDPAGAIHAAAAEEFGDPNVKRAKMEKAGGDVAFPVAIDGRVRQSTDVSPTLRSLAPAALDMVFIEPGLRDKARTWLDKRRDDILRNYAEEGEE